MRAEAVKGPSLPSYGLVRPKLFRRLVDYLRLGDDSTAGFPAFLDQAADKFFIFSTGHSMTGLDSIVEVNGNNVKMTHLIEDIVFDEIGYSPRLSGSTGCF